MRQPKHHTGAPRLPYALVALLLLAVVAVGCGTRTVRLGPAGVVAAPTPASVPVATPAEPTPEPVAASEAPSAAPTPAPAQQGDDACPTWDGAYVEYVVGFHTYPADLEVGQKFACGRIQETAEEPDHPVAFIVVEVWDEADFLTRTADDPNVRYAERNTQGGISDDPPTPSP